MEIFCKFFPQFRHHVQSWHLLGFFHYFIWKGSSWVQGHDEDGRNHWHSDNFCMRELTVKKHSIPMSQLMDSRLEAEVLTRGEKSHKTGGKDPNACEAAGTETADVTRGGSSFNYNRSPSRLPVPFAMQRKVLHGRSADTGTATSSIYCPSNCRKLNFTTGLEVLKSRSISIMFRQGLDVEWLDVHQQRSLTRSVDSYLSIVDGQRIGTPTVQACHKECHPM